MSTIKNEDFTNALLAVLGETFEKVEGYYLDKNTSLFETLATVTAEQASLPVGGQCATLAAQVKHTAFYLDVVAEFVKNPNTPKPDWSEIWRTVNVVSAAEWQAIQDELRSSYHNTQALIRSTPEWPSADEIGGAIGLLAHSAYHLGEIRQALCTLSA